jgi:hypothetical protein
VLFAGSSLAQDFGHKSNDAPPKFDIPHLNERLGEGEFRVAKNSVI